MRTFLIVLAALPLACLSALRVVDAKKQRLRAKERVRRRMRAQGFAPQNS